MSNRGTPSCTTTADLSTRPKLSAKRTGNDPRHFSSHSLRSGGATHMYRSGTDALTIQFHVSDAFKAYTRLCKESVTTLASTMVAGMRAIVYHFQDKVLFDTWVSFMNVFITKNPDNMDEIFSELQSRFTDGPFNKILNEAKKYPSMDTTAMNIQID
ncbi:LOW QUALITY PROTEIN: hypothetical protein PHMEG_0007005 [Phytophthora megakarya]|uniref:Uncharacterized protein n=1 Tax=Phytophthora megakarya TaxID=4795 RepID=A0A225WP13_9STRA|nr:LOW QUALITY PROTEIN: hypothetical protein PHMEG_0007005 [Phytophthora megakarya]